MNFSQALEELKKGNEIQRSGWNGKGMFLALAYPWYEDGRASASVEFNKTYEGVGSSLDNFIVMKTAGNTLVPWLASQTDILAEDWQLVGA
jgi:hypothetical protein